MQGLRGAADLNRDGIVTLQELYECVEQQVTQKSRALGGNQRPMMKGEAERLPALLRLPRVPNPSRCVFAERAGRLVDPETGRPRTSNDPCWGRGVTVGFYFSAARAATAAVKAFLTATLQVNR